MKYHLAVKGHLGPCEGSPGGGLGNAWGRDRGECLGNAWGGTPGGSAWGNDWGDIIEVIKAYGVI